MNKELLRIGSVNYHEAHPSAASAGNFWSSPSVINTLDNRLSNL